MPTFHAPRIVLVGSKDSANVGAAARAMKNFGIDELYLAAPRCRIDDRARSLASHAGDVLDAAVITATTAEALRGCTFVLGTTARGRASEGNVVMLPRAGVARLPAQGGAIMFGPEDTGLSNADLDLCQAFVTIPTGEYASVNLAQAVNIFAYEWFQASREAAADDAFATQGDDQTADPAIGRADPAAAARARPAPREQVEGMYRQMLDVMLHIGYTDPNRAGGVEHIFRRLLDRAEPSAHEVAAIRGLWAQTRWAADQEPRRVPGNRQGAENPGEHESDRVPGNREAAG